MNAKNGLEVMRMGSMQDLNILNPAEQDEILGGDTKTECQKGYSTFLWTSCDCGYKEIVTDEEEPTDPDPETGDD